MKGEGEVLHVYKKENKNFLPLNSYLLAIHVFFMMYAPGNNSFLFIYHGVLKSSISSFQYKDVQQGTEAVVFCGQRLSEADWSAATCPGCGQHYR